MRHCRFEPTNSATLTDYPMSRKPILITLLIICTLLLSGAKAPVRNLPEFVVESNGDKLLHVLAYVREYSTLSTYSDTVFMFREKMVDFMLPGARHKSKTAWSRPRILTSTSYYRFTNDLGLDSVSAVSRHHFSWSDWIGIPPVTPLPVPIEQLTTDTVKDSLFTREIWMKDGDDISVRVNAMSDSERQKWTPDLAEYFSGRVEFDDVIVRFDYANVLRPYLSPLDLNGYRFHIETNGRGHDLFRFNHRTQSVRVVTDAEVYILDREYIDKSEAKKWDKRQFDRDILPILQSADAPPLSDDIKNLISRVESVDTTQVRVDAEVDSRIGYRSNVNNFSPGMRVLNIFKQLTGITLIKSKKNMRDNWREFRKTVREWNDSVK